MQDRKPEKKQLQINEEDESFSIRNSSVSVGTLTKCTTMKNGNLSMKIYDEYKMYHGTEHAPETIKNITRTSPLSHTKYTSYTHTHA